MSETRTQPSLLETLRPVVVLVVLCLAAGTLLGTVHAVTAPIAEANAAKQAQETYAALVPEAASFDELPCDAEGCTAALTARDAAGEAVACIVVAQSKGYGGQVPLAVAFSPDGTVRAVTALANDETPGLGTRVASDSYLGQYVGRAAETLSAEEVDLISGATISSKAALAAFNRAVEAFETLEVH